MTTRFLAQLSGHFKMHRKTLLISPGYFKILILKILNVHADTEH